METQRPGSNRRFDQNRMVWRNRAQLLAVASELMRRILVDHAHALAETGHVLGISVATVERDWQAARAWLLTQLTEDSPR